MSEQFANNAISTLNGSISSSASSLVVVNATNFPTGGNFRILVDSEIMLVIGVTGTTFTLSRGQENTTAASHSTGAVVTHIITAGALAALKTDAAAGTGGWTTAIDVDFTAQASVNPVTDGTHVWGGVSFTKINSAFDMLPCQLVNGTGIQFRPTGQAPGNTGEFSNHTLSALTIPLTTVLSTIDPSTPLRIWLYQSAESQAPQGNGGAGEGPWIAIDDWNGSQYSWAWSSFRGAGGSGNGFYLNLTSPTGGGSQLSLVNFPSPPSVFMMLLPNGTGGREAMMYRSDTFPGGWPLTSALVPFISSNAGSVVYNSSTFTNYQHPSSTRILLGVTGDPGFGGFDGYIASIGRFRVDYHA